LTGKQLKGQTQKTQQTILQVSNRNSCSLFALVSPSHLLYCLQKFRSGVYNVLVATSIGEEGLDIIEVDLVICFDANVSPLRMIQRMGRTGRKHDGQVDILFFHDEI
jgi:fanconi anemia group M protein